MKRITYIHEWYFFFNTYIFNQNINFILIKKFTKYFQKIMHTINFVFYNDIILSVESNYETVY